MTETNGDGYVPEFAPVPQCECGCGRELTGNQTKYATSACKHRVRRNAGKLPELRIHRKAPDPNVAPPFVPSHGGGLLHRQNLWKPGDRRSAQPKAEMRNRFRGVASHVLDELERRVAAATREMPNRATLLTMSREQLVDLLEEVDAWMEVETGELRLLLDTAAKYGIGTKHVHAGDEDGDPTVTGIVILPAFNSES